MICCSHLPKWADLPAGDQWAQMRMRRGPGAAPWFPEHFPPIADGPLVPTPSVTSHPAASTRVFQRTALSQHLWRGKCLEKYVLPPRNLLPPLTDEYRRINTPAPLLPKCNSSGMPPVVFPDLCCRIDPKWDLRWHILAWLLSTLDFPSSFLGMLHSHHSISYHLLLYGIFILSGILVSGSPAIVSLSLYPLYAGENSSAKGLAGSYRATRGSRQGRMPRTSHSSSTFLQRKEGNSSPRWEMKFVPSSFLTS